MGYLTGPVNTLADFQVEWNGLLMGAGTNFGLPPVWQFLDLAPVKGMDVARVWAAGSWSGPDFADVFTPQMDVEITGVGPLSFAAAVQAFINAFGVSPAQQQLWVKIPGLPPQGIWAKTTKRVIPVDLGFEVGQLTTASVQWKCTNPVWQSLPRVIVLQPSAVQASGMVFPLFSSSAGVAPSALDFGQPVSGAFSATVTNSGNADSWLTAVVAGPQPSGFTILLDGHAVTYGAPVATGQQVTVDYAAGTASLLGGVDRTNQLTTRDFTPVTSSSVVTFIAAGGTASITVADRWS